MGVYGRRRLETLAALSKIVLRTGRDLDRLTAEDLLAYHAWEDRRYKVPKTGIAIAWVLLRGIADLDEHLTIRDALRHGQRPTAELVDRWPLRCRPVRDLLVRYFEERRPSLDYSSLRGLMSGLVGNFLADIEHHHPDIDTLRLPVEVVEAWKQRLRVIANPDGTMRPRKDYFDILLMVRSLYLDIQEWAHEDPYWAAWAAPSPVRRGDTRGQQKSRRSRTAQMHQRIRDRLPHLPALVDHAEQRCNEQAALLGAAAAAGINQVFTCDGRDYRRTAPDCYLTGRNQGVTPPSVEVVDLQTGEAINVTRAEDEAFWIWAIVETLRHTGVRVEELVEITHLAVISYRLPDTGEIVPLLQVVPSKSNEERLLPISPELASVLAAIVTRLRTANDGTVPLTARYDNHERTVGPELPHLFQRRLAWRWEVLNDSTIRKLLNRALARTHLRDHAGQPIKYTPHDFRRMFTTEAVSGGLPVHIVARLLGHANLNVTQAYLAVFDEQLPSSWHADLMPTCGASSVNACSITWSASRRASGPRSRRASPRARVLFPPRQARPWCAPAPPPFVRCRGVAAPARPAPDSSAACVPAAAPARTARQRLGRGATRSDASGRALRGAAAPRGLPARSARRTRPRWPACTRW